MQENEKDVKSSEQIVESTEQDVENPLKLDYTLETPEERNELVKKIIESSPPEKLTKRYLEILADYIIFAMTKEQKRSKQINTDNRMITINKRETSFQGLADQFEAGEDGIYNLIANDKNIIFTPKISITQEDLATIPALRELRSAIQQVQEEEKKAHGKKKFLLKKQIIQMRQDQYVIKTSYKQPIFCLNAVKNFHSLTFDDKITVLPDGTIKDESLISFMNPKHVSALLRNYSKLKEDCYGKFYTDGYYMMEVLEDLVDKSLKEKHPLYYKILVYKIDGKPNLEIQNLLEEEFGIRHSIEYISSLWRNKIPKLIVQQAELDFLEWYFSEREKGQWKKCSRCGAIKLAHNKFFSKNSSSKDGFYSICKECRNKSKKHIKPKPQIIKYMKVKDGKVVEVR